MILYQMLDRMVTLRLYPEQEMQVYLHKIRKGRFLFLCSKDGLFPRS